VEFANQLDLLIGLVHRLNVCLSSVIIFATIRCKSNIILGSNISQRCSGWL